MIAHAVCSSIDDTDPADYTNGGGMGHEDDNHHFYRCVGEVGRERSGKLEQSFATSYEACYPLNLRFNFWNFICFSRGKSWA